MSAGLTSLVIRRVPGGIPVRAMILTLTGMALASGVGFVLHGGLALTAANLAIGAIVGGPVYLVAFGLLTPLWLRAMRDTDIDLQRVALEGSTLLITAPAPLTLDLTGPFSAEVARAPRGDRWSLRFFADGTEPVPLLVVATRKEPLPGTGRYLDEPEHWRGEGRVMLLGIESHQHAFGDALLRLLERGSARNGFVTLLRELEVRGEMAPAAPHAVVLQRGQEAAEDAYRGAPPHPERPGFDAWADRAGFHPSAGLTLAAGYLLVDASDGRRVAFPIGGTEATEQPGGLLLRARGADDARVSVRDPLVRAALAAFLERRSTPQRG